jgi:hypothetical protein
MLADPRCALVLLLMGLGAATWRASTVRGNGRQRIDELVAALGH